MKFHITSKKVKDSRPPKADLNPFVPVDFIHEKEVQADGTVAAVNTVFLTNRECPFTCVMCDLWRHTLDSPTPEKAIPSQIEYALSRLPSASVIKLYNSGNFFDGKAIPKSDYSAIVGLLKDYSHVIVENHPKLICSFIPEFKRMLSGTFEIAMGLETVHPEVLPKLNKQITVQNFRDATEFLNSHNVDSRAFILLNPPFLTDRVENIEWCLKSVEFAFDCGVSACTVIPTRAGNGIMDELKEEGEFVEPKLSDLEFVFDEAMKKGGGRVFCDTWDIEKFSDCEKCIHQRKQRLHKMNLNQSVLPTVTCDCR